MISLAGSASDSCDTSPFFLEVSAISSQELVLFALTPVVKDALIEKLMMLRVLSAVLV